MIKVMTIFGTRPEAIKMAPVVKELLKRPGIDTKVCLTAQHREMLDQVVDLFHLPVDYDLDIMKSGQSLYDITARVLRGLEDVLKKEKPDYVLVHGDTTTTFTAALAAFYQQIKIGHVEAGLRTGNLLRRLVEAVPDTEVVFPVHRNPLVREAVSEELEGVAGIHLVEPMEYEPFTNLMARSAIVLTDSGGIQEEAPSLGKPVLVLRDTTERPEAVEAGTVKLVGTDEEKIFRTAYELLTDEKAYKAMAEAVNPYGDGHSAERIADALLYIEGLSDKKPTKFIAK